MWIKAEDGSLYNASRICRIQIDQPPQDVLHWAVYADVEGLPEGRVPLTTPGTNPEAAEMALARIAAHTMGTLDLTVPSTGRKGHGFKPDPMSPRHSGRPAAGR